MLHALLLLSIFSIVSSDDPQVQLPVRPPQPYAREIQNLSAFVRAASGNRAIDCGIVNEDESPRAVDECMEKSFQSDTAFYSIFVPGKAGANTRILWSAVPMASFSKGDGVLRSAAADERGTVRDGVLFDKRKDIHPFRAGGLVRPPAPIENSAELAGGDRAISGLVIIECEISRTGRVESQRVLKPLAGNVTALAQQLVQTLQFRPATILGYPTSVLFNVTVAVENGVVRLAR
jgi:hypothetical protein